VTPANRRDYGTGSIYPTKEGRYRGTIEAGWNPNGTRRRITASGKTAAIVKRRLRDKTLALEHGQTTERRITVKQWATTYLAMRVHDLAPKAYHAAENPIRNWIIPTIGQRRLTELRPADVRAVHDACRRAGRAAGDVHRALHTMLTTALAEGHHVPATALAVKAPKAARSDRGAMTIPEGVACLDVASTLPHGSRWAFTLLYGARLGECLGMTWDAIDLETNVARIEWQLQSLPYNVAYDRASGFRVPDQYEARHLVDSFHLVRPKSKKGRRLAPLLPLVAASLEHWRTLAPDNPWGLVWPTAAGRPANDKDDRLEWHALQGTAGVGHPAGRPYHVHETRNFAATMLFGAGVPEHVITDLLGHTSIGTSEGYRTERIEELRDAMQRVGARLALG
jgi:integrase